MGYPDTLYDVKDIFTPVIALWMEEFDKELESIRGELECT